MFCFSRFVFALSQLMLVLLDMESPRLQPVHVLSWEIYSDTARLDGETPSAKPHLDKFHESIHLWHLPTTSSASDASQK